MFRFFRKPQSPQANQSDALSEHTDQVLAKVPLNTQWIQRLGQGLQKTKLSLMSAFTGARIDENLYEELESSLILSDAGIKATEAILNLLKQEVKSKNITDPHQVRDLLLHILTNWLTVLEGSLDIGKQPTTVIMVAGVNGAGKTTTIGKLTRHLTAQGAKVLLAAADTFRAAAKEQLLTWADRNQVDIVSQADGDPAAVSFDAVNAGRARNCDVVIIDTAGRLPTQVHLMEELKKIKRVLQKADPTAPHELILVLDGHMGQNALQQAQSFDAAIGLTGLILTKLDGTAKGGILAAIAHWNQERLRQGQQSIPVFFIGIGEGLDDLQVFKAREFAHALLD